MIREHLGAMSIPQERGCEEACGSGSAPRAWILEESREKLRQTSSGRSRVRRLSRRVAQWKAKFLGEGSSLRKPFLRSTRWCSLRSHPLSQDGTRPGSVFPQSLRRAMGEGRIFLPKMKTSSFIHRPRSTWASRSSARPDGYHEVEIVMRGEPLDTIRSSRTGGIELSGHCRPAPERGRSNLWRCVVAAESLRRWRESRLGPGITLS